MKPQQLIVLIALLTLGALLTAVFVRPKRGLDIQGGARVVLQADTTQLPSGQKWDANTRQAVTRTIENRVNANGVAEPVITPKGADQFVVEIPAVRNEKEVLEQLQNTAQLQFFYSPDWRTNRNRLGRYEIAPVKGTENNHEEYTITDTTTGKTFHDLYHINQSLRALMDKGNSDNAAVSTPLLPPLSDLSAAGGQGSIKVAPADTAALETLRDEARNFNTFLAGATRELDGSDILPTVRGAFDPSGKSGVVIELEFNPRGAEKFANFTRDHTNEVLMIYLDGRILTAPNINDPILNGKAQISGFATLKEAKQVSDLLNGGALPVPLKIVQQQSVEATLGNQAVTQGFIAGGVGLLLVCAFMIAYYLLPGTVAVGALLLYTLFTYAIFLLIPVTFTLPGIAGFILSVGMAVDANILIFERTKEELREGKPLKQAVPAGFGRAFSAIFDSNMCTAVTSCLLYYFGSGPVKGFALTLLIGVGVSMFTAITVTRSALLLLMSRNPSQSLSSWGVNRQINPRMNVVGKRGFWYGLSLLIIVPGIIFAALGGFKQGIEFTGGSELTLKFSQSHTRAEIEKAVRDGGIVDPAAQIAGDNTVLVRLPYQKGADGKPAQVTATQADQITANLQKAFPNDNVTRQGFDFIGSSISSELTKNAFTSIILSSLFIVFYLAFRFAVGGFANGLKFGIGAIIAMLHDVLVLVGLFSALGYLLNWKVDSLFVTAALTVIGFSVHDTIIIFDRIRENLRGRNASTDFQTVVNDSINETFARSIFTSLTVVMTLLALLIFGGPVIRPLNAALLIGIISGTYSSIFNAAPLVVDWQKRFGGKLAGSASGASQTRPAAPRTTPAAATPSPASAADKPAFPRSPKAAPQVDGNGARTYDADANNDAVGSGPKLPPGPPRPRKRRM